MGQSSEQHIHEQEKEALYCRMEVGHYFSLQSEQRQSIEVLSVHDDRPEYKEDDTLKGMYKDKRKLVDMIKERKQTIKDKIK